MYIIEKIKENLLSVTIGIVLGLLLVVYCHENQLKDTCYTFSNSEPKNELESPTMPIRITFNTKEIVKVKKVAKETELVAETVSPFDTEMMKLYNSDLQPKDKLITYKSIMSKYDKNYKSIYDVYSAEEIYLMQRCVQTETNQCGDFMGRCNVASVLINRLNSGLFGETMTEIITNDGQFAYWRTEIEEDTKLALEYIFIFGDTTNNCIGFHSFKTYKQVWNGWNYSFTDNIGHHFFKLN